MKINFKTLPNQQLGNSVRCSEANITRLSKIFNKNTLSALDNYATKKNMTVYFQTLENDLFDNTSMTVFKRGEDDIKTYAMNLSEGSKDSFCDSLKLIYKNIENAYNSFKK